jgi:hypothetical protein
MQGLRKENMLWFLKCVAQNVLLPRQKARAHQLTAGPTQAGQSRCERASQLFRFHFTARDDERGAAGGHGSGSSIRGD